jgi:DNA-binding NtrC family response regulator
VFPIQLPPLRERREDIPLLVDHFIQQMNQKTGKNVLRISQPALRIFMDYSWPGNVRELENAIEHAFVLCDRDQIEDSDLPFEIREPRANSACRDLPPVTAPRRKKMTKAELLDLLDACDWNKAEVGRRVGLSHTAIWKYMKKWNIPLQREE